VLEVINKETNFCSEEYSRKLREALEGVKLYLRPFGVGRDVVE